MIDKLARFIAGHPKIILLAASLLLIPSFFGYISTFVNYDIMSYLPEDIESVQGEAVLDKEFGLAANAFLVIDDMSPKDVVKIKSEIAGVEGVSNVTWVDDIADISIPKEILPDAVTDIFYANGGKSTLLMIQFEQGSATTATMNAIKEIRTKLNKQCFLSGMSAIITDTKDLSDSEAPKYIVIAVVLALIALSFTMDSFVLPLVLLTALGYAVIYNLGTNFFMPGGISYITQSVAAILQLGVTMDYSVFLMDRFNEEQKNTDNRTEAMAKAVSSTFVSLTGSSLTTIFGFLALCFMSLTLGFDIGIVMAKGVVFGVITVVVVLPAFLLIFYKPIYKFRHRRIIPGFRHLNKFVIKHRKVIAVIFAALIIPSYIAKSAVPLDYVISNALPEQLDSVQALGKLKGDFNMATTHFVIIDDDVPSGRVSEMIDEFEAVDGISGIISLNSFVGPAISENMLPESIKQICFKNGKQLMMVNSVYTPSSNEENTQVDELTSIVKKYDPSGYLTGEGAMSKDLITVTDKDFKVNIEVNHATLAGHTFEHELACAVDAGMLGSIDANRGDAQNGWDTDQFPIDNFELTQAWMHIVRNGGLGTGGTNFDAKTRRNSTDLEDIFIAHISGMDACARALLNAVEIMEKSPIPSMLKERYASFDSGIGKEFEEGKLTLEQVYEYGKKVGEPKQTSGKQELYETIVALYTK